VARVEVWVRPVALTFVPPRKLNAHTTGCGAGEYDTRGSFALNRRMTAFGWSPR